MKSLRELYRIGTGPSSSHTMGPRKAAELYRTLYPNASRYEVILYGSLAATGKGHLTDVAIIDELSKTGKPVEIVWKPDVFLDYHPNGMTFRCYDADGKMLNERTIFSVGGGALEEPGNPRNEEREVYSLNTLSDIMAYCESTGHTYWEYVEQCEGPEIWDYLAKVWGVMKTPLSGAQS